MNCKCIQKIEKRLSEIDSNAQLDLMHGFDVIGKKMFTLMQIALTKRDIKRRKSIIRLAVSYCPVCGKKT